MPNDVPDWTGQQRVNIRGEVSGAPLGDTGAAALDRDSVTDNLSWSGGTVQGVSAVLASFKPAVGSTIAQVGALGAFTRSLTTAVNPPFGQATTAGNFLLAWVTSNGLEATTAAAGWARVLSRKNPVSGVWAGLWAKPNCGAAEAAPQFTTVNPAGALFAQLAEFSGVALAAATDQTASADATVSPITVRAAAPDAGFGDLVAEVSSWFMNFPQTTAVFSATANNSAALVHAGDSGGFAFQQFASFNYAIIPAATTVLPLGVSDWPHDVSATSAPAVGVQATVTLAATPGKRWVTAHLGAGTTASTATATNTDVILKDGVTAIWTEMLSSQAAIGSQDKINLRGLGYRGSVGNAMTFGFTAAQGSQFQRVNVGAYLR